MKGRVTIIEVSLLSAIFILFALGYSTYLTMQEATHTEEAAAMMRGLQAAGVASASWTGHCTYSDPDKFYSYRRSVHQREADYGRLMSTIRL